VTLRADVYRPEAPGRFPILTPFAQPLLDQAYRRLPLMACGDLLRPVARSLTDDLRHSEDGPYWWAINGVHVPVTQAWQWR
jgi:hypothetical protein